MSEVKEQSKRNGFASHPENINKAGAPPKTHWWTTLLIEEAERASEKMEGLKKKEVMARALVAKAEEGDLPSIKEFGDRVQGKAPQGLELSGTGENGAINVNIKMV